MYFTRLGSRTSYISGTLLSVLENISVKNEIKMLLVSENVNEQIAVKSKNCMGNQFESWTTEKTSIIQIAITRQV